MIICLPGLRRPRQDARDFQFTHMRSQDRNNRSRDFILHRENVHHLTIVALRPTMSASDGIDELGCDPNVLSNLSDTAFQ